MKIAKITYWVSSAIMTTMMLLSAYAYLTQDTIRENFRHLGFPDYFRIELAIAKLLGAILLILPIGARLKEWVYAGFTIVFISAFIAHTASSDPIANKIGPLVFIVLLAVSYFTYHKIQLHKNLAPRQF